MSTSSKFLWDCHHSVHRIRVHNSCMLSLQTVCIIRLNLHPTHPMLSLRSVLSRTLLEVSERFVRKDFMRCIWNQIHNGGARLLLAQDDSLSLVSLTKVGFFGTKSVTTATYLSCLWNQIKGLWQGSPSLHMYRDRCLWDQASCYAI